VGTNEGGRACPTARKRSGEQVVLVGAPLVFLVLLVVAAVIALAIFAAGAGGVGAKKQAEAARKGAEDDTKKDEPGFFG
jgi:hypothetical protein